MTTWEQVGTTYSGTLVVKDGQGVYVSQYYQFYTNYDSSTNGTLVFVCTDEFTYVNLYDE